MPKARLSRLNPTQVEILQLLLKREEESGEEAETSRQQITDVIGIAALNSALGPTWLDNIDRHPESLLARKMVQGATYQKDSGRGMVSYTLTHTGRIAAKKYKSQRGGRKEDKIPSEILDPVCLKMMPTRTYGWEVYTDEDMRELRDKLPKQYHYLTEDQIRQQCIIRRKVGAFKQKEQIPDWYQNYRESEHWKEIEKEAIYASLAACSANMEHTEELAAYHRTFGTLGQEEKSHLIVLCSKCRERLAKSLPAIPPVMPES